MAEENRRSVREKARDLVAKLTERFATNVIAPPKRPLADHVLVITTRWQTDDPSVILEAVERGKNRAQKGSGFLSRFFFGTLRFMGFGYIEPSGGGGVELDDEDGVYVVRTSINVKVEDNGSASVEELQRRAKKLSSGVISALTGVKPGKARLLDIEIDMV